MAGLAGSARLARCAAAHPGRQHVRGGPWGLHVGHCPPCGCHRGRHCDGSKRARQWTLSVWVHGPPHQLPGGQLNACAAAQHGCRACPSPALTGQHSDRVRRCQLPRGWPVLCELSAGNGMHASAARGRPLGARSTGRMVAVAPDRLPHVAHTRPRFSSQCYRSLWMCARSAHRLPVGTVRQCLQPRGDILF